MNLVDSSGLARVFRRRAERDEESSQIRKQKSEKEAGLRSDFYFPISDLCCGPRIAISSESMA